jgi:anti-sigma regulatory factor (Ser/Thr protein kinase)
VTEPEQDFRSRPASVAAARRFVADALLRARVADELIDRATLLVSELVTASVLNAAGGLRVRVLVGDGVRVEVRDRSPSLPIAPDRTGAPRLGLYLLDALATEWGWEPGPEGKCVWFELG